jgi:hypothetical protein
MTAVSCMAQLTAVSSWLTSGHQICCWDGCARPLNFLLYEDEYMRHQQDGAPPHYHCDVRAYLDNTSPDRCIGRRGSVEYPLRSLNLTPPNFSLWGYLKDAVYSTKPSTLQELWKEIERSCAAVPAATLVATWQSVVHCCQLCHAANGGHFEHMHWIR